MKLLIFALFLLCISCNQKTPSAPQQAPTPKALENNAGDYSLEIKKIRYDDLVQDLYNEILETNKSLHELDKKIRNMSSEKTDSLSTYSDFYGKNKQYYNTAMNYTSQITDSVFKKKIEQIVSNSQVAFEKQIAVHKNLVDEADSLHKSLSNLHVAIKLFTTLEVIEKYQKLHAPSIQPIQAINNKYKALITQSDSLIKK